MKLFSASAPGLPAIPGQSKGDIFMQENKSRLIIALIAVIIIALSVPGVLDSWYLVKLHYKKPGRTLELMKRYSFVKPLKKFIPEMYLLGIDTGARDPYDLVANKKAIEQLKLLKKHKEDCDINKTWSCSLVDDSPYSEIAGIGVAIFGLAGYVSLILLGLVTLILRPKTPNICTHLITIGAITGFAFSVYLTALEAFVIHAFCPHCVKSAAYMTVIFVAVAIQYLVLRRMKKS
jgi:uncharacterized membrane protein